MVSLHGKRQNIPEHTFFFQTTALSTDLVPVRFGEPEADGTGDPKRVRCPSIGSCMILMQTLSSRDILRSKLDAFELN